MAFKKYNLSDKELAQLAAAAAKEQRSERGQKWEMCLMANLAEKRGYSNPRNFVINSGWFAKAARSAASGSGTTNQTKIGWARSIFNEGKRMIPSYIDEHDCFSDLTSAKNNGKGISITNRSAYIKDVTVIKNRYGSTWTFYGFPGASDDPFGYTKKGKEEDLYDDSTTLSSGSSQKVEDTSIGKPAKAFDLIVKSIGKVNIYSQTGINCGRDCYNTLLSAEEKAKITTYSTLVDAEKIWKTKYQPIVDAIDKLIDVGVINTKDYWYKHCEDIKYMPQLLIKMGKLNAYIDEVDMNIQTVDQALYKISMFVPGGLDINYWMNNYKKIQYLETLLIKGARQLKMNAESAIVMLINKGVINNGGPAHHYWEENYSKIPKLSDLLLRFAEWDYDTKTRPENVIPKIYQEQTERNVTSTQKQVVDNRKIVTNGQAISQYFGFLNLNGLMTKQDYFYWIQRASSTNITYFAQLLYNVCSRVILKNKSIYDDAACDHIDLLNVDRENNGNKIDDAHHILYFNNENYTIVKQGYSKDKVNNDDETDNTIIDREGNNITKQTTFTHYIPDLAIYGGGAKPDSITVDNTLHFNVPLESFLDTGGSDQYIKADKLKDGVRYSNTTIPAKTNVILNQTFTSLSKLQDYANNVENWKNIIGKVNDVYKKYTGSSKDYIHNSTFWIDLGIVEEYYPTWSEKIIQFTPLYKYNNQNELVPILGSYVFCFQMIKESECEKIELREFTQDSPIEFFHPHVIDSRTGKETEQIIDNIYCCEIVFGEFDPYPKSYSLCFTGKQNANYSNLREVGVKWHVDLYNMTFGPKTGETLTPKPYIPGLLELPVVQFNHDNINYDNTLKLPYQELYGLNIGSGDQILRNTYYHLPPHDYTGEANMVHVSNIYNYKKWEDIPESQQQILIKQNLVGNNSSYSYVYNFDDQNNAQLTQPIVKIEDNIFNVYQKINTGNSTSISSEHVLEKPTFETVKTSINPVYYIKEGNIIYQGSALQPSDKTWYDTITVNDIFIGINGGYWKKYLVKSYEFKDTYYEMSLTNETINVKKIIDEETKEDICELNINQWLHNNIKANILSGGCYSNSENSDWKILQFDANITVTYENMVYYLNIQNKFINEQYELSDNSNVYFRSADITINQNANANVNLAVDKISNNQPIREYWLSDVFYPSLGQIYRRVNSFADFYKDKYLTETQDLLSLQQYAYNNIVHIQSSQETIDNGAYSYTTPAGITMPATENEQQLIVAGSVSDNTKAKFWYRRRGTSNWTDDATTIKTQDVNVYNIYYYIEGLDNNPSVGSEDEPAGIIISKIVMPYIIANKIQDVWGKGGNVRYQYKGNDYNNILNNDNWIIISDDTFNTPIPLEVNYWETAIGDISSKPSLEDLINKDNKYYILYEGIYQLANDLSSYLREPIQVSNKPSQDDFINPDNEYYATFNGVNLISASIAIKSIEDYATFPVDNIYQLEHYTDLINNDIKQALPLQYIKPNLDKFTISETRAASDDDPGYFIAISRNHYSVYPHEEHPEVVEEQYDGVSAGSAAGGVDIKYDPDLEPQSGGN